MVMTKSVTQRSREYRAKQAVKIKKIARNNKQRCRKYRERQRTLKSSINFLGISLPNAIKLLSNMENIVNFRNSGPSNALNYEHNPLIKPYTEFNTHIYIHREFKKRVFSNPFGLVCTICDRLWFKNDLQAVDVKYETLLKSVDPEINIKDTVGCKTCLHSLSENRIPDLSKYNGFRYPEIPSHLPELDLVSERLISPRIPFIQIRRLRYAYGQDKTLGQIINVPVDVNSMVYKLPRSINDDYLINVHIKRKLISKSSNIYSIINKKNIETWLQYLITTPIYKFHNITINEFFFNTKISITELPRNEISEIIPVDECLIGQQQTLVWNEKKYLRIGSSGKNTVETIIFEEGIEELSFPSIYLGQYRKFNKNIRVTPFMIASSELRRSDRRGVTPNHLLYMAMKIMRLKVRDSLPIIYKRIENDMKITKEQIELNEYVNNCVENTLTFLRSIPNSIWYWSERKHDLCAMMRQLGKPTMFLTLSANEMGWVPLLKLLYKLKNNGVEISEEGISQLHFIEKSKLINEDAVTCTIYFDKLVNVLISILQSKKCNPFGKYRVIDYFKKMEFQHSGSPQAHFFLWLDNAPVDPLGADKEKTIKLIDEIISVSEKESSGNIKLQTHQYTFKYYDKNIISNKGKQLRFKPPFMPMPSTMILTPMNKRQKGYSKYLEHYKKLREDLKIKNYRDMDSFYASNKIKSFSHYIDILRSGITRPEVFLKRELSEKWHDAFNPFILSVLQSKTEIQFILEEHSCASYITEYISKTNRGMSDLREQIVKTMNEHPQLNSLELTKRMSDDILNTVEITSLEAAWYLLREPMFKSSKAIIDIPTIWPLERHRVRKTLQDLEKLDFEDDCATMRRENWFDKYVNRPKNIEDVTLAQFVSYYTSNFNNEYIKQKEPRIIRYHNYSETSDFTEYLREMVTLHFPFRNEQTEILENRNWKKIFDEHKNLILERKKEFESNLNIKKVLEICRNSGCEDEILKNDLEIYNSIVQNEKLGITNHQGVKTSMVTLQDEFRRLSTDISTINSASTDLITFREELPMFSFNCQNLNAHKKNSNDKITQNSKTQLVSETKLENEKNLYVPKFDCMVKFKCQQTSNSTSMIYDGSTDAPASIVTPHVDINLGQSSGLSINIRDGIEISTVQCLLKNEQHIITVAIYVPPNKSIEKIIGFIHEVLLLYTNDGAVLLKENCNEIPMILSGVFNLNFSSEDAQLLIEYFKSKLNLKIHDNPKKSTTRSGTTIDAIFSRYLDQLLSAAHILFLCQ